MQSKGRLAVQLGRKYSLAGSFPTGPELAFAARELLESDHERSTSEVSRDRG
jgi:hypothetical protein